MLQKSKILSIVLGLITCLISLALVYKDHTTLAMQDEKRNHAVTQSHDAPSAVVALQALLPLIWKHTTSNP